MEEKPRTTPYPLRMPDELRAQLEDAAKNGSRSLHAEIVARLQESFDGPKLGFGPGSVGEQLQKARQELDEAREKLSDKAAAIADQLLDRMQERGLVVSKELAEASALRKRLATSPKARKPSADEKAKLPGKSGRSPK